MPLIMMRGPEISLETMHTLSVIMNIIFVLYLSWTGKFFIKKDNSTIHTVKEEGTGKNLKSYPFIRMPGRWGRIASNNKKFERLIKKDKELHKLFWNNGLSRDNTYNEENDDLRLMIKLQKYGFDYDEIRDLFSKSDRFPIKTLKELWGQAAIKIENEKYE